MAQFQRTNPFRLYEGVILEGEWICCIKNNDQNETWLLKAWVLDHLPLIDL